MKFGIHPIRRMVTAVHSLTLGRIATGLTTTLLFTGSLAMPVYGQTSASGWSSSSSTQQQTPSTTSRPQVPAHLFMPPNPPAPGRAKAKAEHATNLLAERTTNYFHASPSQAKNIELIAKRLNGTVVKPGQTFSYNKLLGPYTEANGYGWGRAFSGDRIVPSMGGGVCQGASTLYSALIRTQGYQIVERHNHSLLVPYLPPGEDATVSMSSRLDFRFKNTSKRPLVIGAATDDDHRYLTVALWGSEKPPEVTVHHKMLSTSSYRTVRRKDASLPSGKEKVMAPGQPGVKVRTWVTFGKGANATTRDLGVDAYRPSPRVVYYHDAKTK